MTKYIILGYEYETIEEARDAFTNTIDAEELLKKLIEIFPADKIIQNIDLEMALEAEDELFNDNIEIVEEDDDEEDN